MQEATEIVGRTDEDRLRASPFFALLLDEIEQRVRDGHERATTRRPAPARRETVRSERLYAYD